jgi:hypothetical protein
LRRKAADETVGVEKGEKEDKVEKSLDEDEHIADFHRLVKISDYPQFNNKTNNNQRLCACGRRKSSYCCYGCSMFTMEDKAKPVLHVFCTPLREYCTYYVRHIIKLAKKGGTNEV